jgi:hypothetical protein
MVKDKERSWVEQQEQQMRDFERKIMEKEKWYEAMKIQEYADLHKVISEKEKEVFSLQEQLSTTYKDLSFENDTLRKQIIEISNESALKDRMLKSQALAHDD